MSGDRTVWVDAERCTGCAECVEICPPEAISMLAGKIHVDEETCTGCQACVDACPEGAIRPLLHGEIVALEEQPAPAQWCSSPLAESGGVAVAVASVGLLARVASFLVQMARYWLAGRSTGARQSLGTTASASSRGGEGRSDGAGRRARHRRRGG